MKKRYFKSRPKALPKGYDSKLEYRLHQGPLKNTQHHPPKEDLIQYSVTHTYEPDFYFEYDGTMFVVESKGRARDNAEMRKYIFVRDYLKDWHLFQNSKCDTIELVFLFENANTPFPFAKKRKDGTKRSHGEWATKNKFKWLCEKRGDLEGIETLEDFVNKIGEMN